MRRALGSAVVTILAFAATFAPSAHAVVFFNTGDPSYNTTAPTGTLAGSGWQWAGNWGGYIGTPIGPHHFLTAAHVGGNVGDNFVFGGVAFTVTAIFDDPATDLRICEVDTSFPTWAPIYRTSDEDGRSFVAIGTGVCRGAPVYAGANLAGWAWGTTSGVMRWGQNSVAAIESYPSYGDVLYSVFYSSSNPNQATLAYNDSSGPVFINNGSGWQLAGIALAADGPFSESSTGSSPFNASLFDGRGLYLENSGTTPPTWDLIMGASPVPFGFYATRVSARAAWIDSIVPGPEGGDSPLFTGPEAAVLAAVLALIGSARIPRFRREDGGE